MKFSASTINSLSKCGYKYFLEKVQGQKEPGKRGYNMLQGDIVGEALQQCCLILNDKKSLTDDDINHALIAAYRKHYTKAEIPEDLLYSITRLLFDGLDEDVMREIDALSHTINASPLYEFNPPPPLKSGKISTNRKKPPLSMKIVHTVEDVQWFFSLSPYETLIRDAISVHPEKYFNAPINDPYAVTINGVTHEEQDYVDGYVDLFVYAKDGSQHIFEFKYTSTSWDQSIVDRAVQVNTYALAFDHVAQVTLFDLQGHNFIVAQPTPEMTALTKQRYEFARRMVINQAYTPLCGTDPYTEKFLMCGFKTNGGCPFAGGCPSTEDEEVAA